MQFKFTKQRWLGYILLVLGIFFFVACSTYLFGSVKGWTWDISQRAELSQEIILAEAPCLFSICPGSTRATVIEELSQSELLYGIDYGDTYTTVSFSIKEGGYGYIDFRNEHDVADHIALSLPNITLGAVLEILGEPDEIFLMYGCGRGAHIHARLFYREKGAEILLQYSATRQESRNRGASITLNDSIPTSTIWYFDPEKYNGWLKYTLSRIRRSGYFDMPVNVDETIMLAAVQPWPGLGGPIEAIDLCPR